MPSVSRNAAEKIRNELENVLQERSDRRKTGRNEGGRLDGERDERREDGDPVMGFGKHHGKMCKEVYRDDQQYCE